MFKTLMLLLLLHSILTNTSAIEIKEISTEEMVTKREGCDEALGMESGSVSDDQLSASSSFDHIIVGPHNARIRTEKQGGAWCPKEPVNQNSYEWLQINLKEVHVIASIELQGRYGGSQGKEYTEWVAIEFRRFNSSKWIKYPQTIQGNDNTYVPVKRKLPHHLIASQFRILPVSKVTRTVCLRVELYGCLWTANGLSHYNMPQGYTFTKTSSSSSLLAAPYNVTDDTYDGMLTNDILTNGVGLLVDGDRREGDSDLEKFVGWKKGVPGNCDVVCEFVWIEFVFQEVRIFNEMVITGLQIASENIELPHKVVVYFAHSHDNYSENSIEHNLHARTLNANKKNNVKLSLNDRIAKYLKLLLYFHNEWIVLGEVEFTSNITDLHTDPYFNIQPVPTVLSIKFLQMISLHLPLVILVLSASILLIAVVLIFTSVIFCRSKNRNKKKTSSTQNGNTLITLDRIDREIESINGKCYNKEWDSRSPKSARSWFMKSDASEKQEKCSQNWSEIMGSPKSEVADQSIYEETMTCIQSRKLPKLPSAMEWSGFYNGSHKYIKPRKNSNHMASDTPSTTNCTVRSDHSHSPYPLKKFYPTILYHDRFHSAHVFDPVIYKDYLSKRNTFRTVSIDGNLSKNMCEDDSSINKSEKINIPSCQCSLQMHNASQVTFSTVKSSTKEETWKHLPREKLVYLREIGEGPFGKICLCEMMPSVLKNSHISKREKVIVKLLKEENYADIKSYFFEELRLMSRLKHTNIATLVGACIDEFPYCIVTEYLSNGDLKKFLQHFTKIHPVICSPENRIISYDVLAYFCYQISNGMEYLESLNLVHRDLATRNCLVGEKGLIKISDFGMSKCLHSSDYYQIQGIAVLPIRWMAWESVFLGKFSTQSDVWSFGVTLWEIMTLTKQQPYSQLTDEEVIENCQKCFHKSQISSNSCDHNQQNIDGFSCVCIPTHTIDKNFNFKINIDNSDISLEQDYDDVDDINKSCYKNPTNFHNSKINNNTPEICQVNTDNNKLNVCTKTYKTQKNLDCHESYHPTVLSKPSMCPDKFYNLMLSCWSIESSSRPRFVQLKRTLRSTFDVDLVNNGVESLHEFTSQRLQNECFSLDNRKRISFSNSSLSSPLFE